MPRLLTILGNRHCILLLRYMLATFNKESQVEQRSTWCFVNPGICNKEAIVSWSSTRTNWEATNLLQSSQCTQGGKETWSQSHIGQIPDRSALLRLTKNWMGWEHMYCLQRNRKCGPFLRCDKMRTKQKWKLVEARAELCECKWTSRSPRWLQRSKEDL